MAGKKKPTEPTPEQQETQVAKTRKRRPETLLRQQVDRKYKAWCELHSHPPEKLGLVYRAFVGGWTFGKEAASNG